jgi:hypothetical protein
MRTRYWPLGVASGIVKLILLAAGKHVSISKSSVWRRKLLSVLTAATLTYQCLCMTSQEPDHQMSDLFDVCKDQLFDFLSHVLFTGLHDLEPAISISLVRRRGFRTPYTSPLPSQVAAVDPLGTLAIYAITGPGW